MDEIYNQLISNCPCLEDMPDYRNAIDYLINILSNATCWNQNQCESLVRSEREEIFTINRGDINYNCHSCDMGILTFKPFYSYPFYGDTISAKIVRQSGLEETVEDVSLDDIHYSEYTGEIKIKLDEYFPRCQCKCERALIIISYEAGYERIPDCILPDICCVMTSLEAFRLNCGTLKECCDMKAPARNAKLKAKKIGEINYTWIYDDKPDTLSLLQDMYTSMFIKNLSQLSLCDGSLAKNIWAVKTDSCRNRGVNRCNGLP